MRINILFFIVALFLCLTSECFAQKPKVQQLTTFDKKPIRFGFYFGINTMDAGMTFYDNVNLNPNFNSDLEVIEQEYIDKNIYSTTEPIYAEVGTLSPGFSVGIVTNFRINQSLDLRILPGMSFGQRKLYYTEPIFNDILNPIETIPFIESRSSYIDLPILIKYKAQRIINQRPYIVFGPSFHFDLEKEDKETYKFNTDNTTINFDLGVGLDSYMQFFRLSTELKYSFGINNIIKHDLGGDSGSSPPVYSYPIKTFHSHMFTFLLYFE